MCYSSHMEWRGGKLLDSDFELEGRGFAVWPYATCAGCSHCDGTQATLTLDEARNRLVCRDCADALT